MANSSVDTIPGRFEVRPTASDHFSWLRTRLSVERTMMSWVRTATALIGFGFTIVQFFARIQETPGVTPAYFPDAPRYLGLSLIFCGVMALVISIWEYHWGFITFGAGGRPNRQFRTTRSTQGASHGKV
jgi:putative membrane protein